MTSDSNPAEPPAEPSPAEPLPMRRPFWPLAGLAQGFIFGAGGASPELLRRWELGVWDAGAPGTLHTVYAGAAFLLAFGALLLLGRAWKAGRWPFEPLDEASPLDAAWAYMVCAGVGGFGCGLIGLVPRAEFAGLLLVATVVPVTLLGYVADTDQRPWSATGAMGIYPATQAATLYLAVSVAQGRTYRNTDVVDAFSLAAAAAFGLTILCHLLVARSIGEPAKAKRALPALLGLVLVAVCSHAVREQLVGGYEARLEWDPARQGLNLEIGGPRRAPPVELELLGCTQAGRALAFHGTGDGRGSSSDRRQVSKRLRLSTAPAAGTPLRIAFRVVLADGRRAESAVSIQPSGVGPATRYRDLSDVSWAPE